MFVFQLIKKEYSPKGEFSNGGDVEWSQNSVTMKSSLVIIFMGLGNEIIVVMFGFIIQNLCADCTIVNL